jgi:hypothetical protein
MPDVGCDDWMGGDKSLGDVPTFIFLDGSSAIFSAEKAARVFLGVRSFKEITLEVKPDVVGC